MSKAIKLTDTVIDDLCKDFRGFLSSAKILDGKVSYTKSFQNNDEKATLFFTETAWIKMVTLINEFDKEVAWHGVAKRGDSKDKNEYIISDIMVYPQEVTGATVNTDQDLYQNWLYSFDDEIFNHIRMQGHSHVNMSTIPSSVDLAHQSSILEQLNSDMFYIFIIMNKRLEKTIKIYDMSKNLLFETSDITIDFIDDGLGLREFISDAKQMVKDKIYIYKPAKSEGSYCGKRQIEHKGCGIYSYNPVDDDQDESLLLEDDECIDGVNDVLAPCSFKKNKNKVKKGKRKYLRE